MVNPVENATNLFLQLWNSLPGPIVAIVSLSLGLTFLIAIIAFIFKIR